MVAIIISIKKHSRLFAFSLLLAVAAIFIIVLLTNDGEMSVQQFSYTTQEGVQYTITMDQHPDSQSGRLNVRMFTLDTSSEPLAPIKAVYFTSDGQYFDCDISLDVPSCRNDENATKGVVYLKAFPVHEIY